MLRQLQTNMIANDLVRVTRRTLTPNDKKAQFAFSGMVGIVVTLGYAVAEFVGYMNGQWTQGTFQASLPGVWLGAFPAFFQTSVALTVSCSCKMSLARSQFYYNHMIFFTMLDLVTLGVFSWLMGSLTESFNSMAFKCRAAEVALACLQLLINITNLRALRFLLKAQQRGVQSGNAPQISTISNIGVSGSTGAPSVSQFVSVVQSVELPVPLPVPVPVPVPVRSMAYQMQVRSPAPQRSVRSSVNRNAPGPVDLEIYQYAQQFSMHTSFESDFALSNIHEDTLNDSVFSAPDAFAPPSYDSVITSDAK